MVNINFFSFISSYLYYLIFFRFLAKWIFEGECGKEHTDFFIRENPAMENVYSRKFWTQRFVLRIGKVPGFLKGLEKDILVCGKSMALLKICAPDVRFIFLVSFIYIHTVMSKVGVCQ